MRRIAIALTAALSTALLLAGCGSGGNPSTTPTTPPTESAPAGGAAGVGDAPGGGSTSAPAGTSTTTAAGSGHGAGGTTRCHTADLSLALDADKGGGAAGSYGQLLVFANKSGHTCTLYGYPGVSWVAGAQGTQVNLPFTRTDAPQSTVRLAVGAKAHAIIIQAQYLNFPAATCKPVSIRGYRVYPPDEKAAVFISAPQKVCSAENQGVGQVFPIAKGASD